MEKRIIRPMKVVNVLLVTQGKNGGEKLLSVIKGRLKDAYYDFKHRLNKACPICERETWYYCRCKICRKWVCGICAIHYGKSTKICFDCDLDYWITDLDKLPKALKSQNYTLFLFLVDHITFNAGIHGEIYGSEYFIIEAYSRAKTLDIAFQEPGMDGLR